MASRRKKNSKFSSAPKLDTPSIAENAIAEKRFDVFIIVLLLLFALYQSISFFGYRQIPNSDFPAFVEVAKKILAFELPGTFKRLPGLGLIQIGLSKFVGGQHPVLTAGWLLNSILHPFSIVLLYLIAKRFVGKAAFWIALIFAINPWTIELLSQPMAETTLMFFIMLTFYLILKRSNWCYVAACAATVIRYDAGALIVAAFIADLLNCKNKKQFLYAILKSALAFIPLGIWVLLTKINWQASSKSHYLHHYTAAKHVGLSYLDLLWKTAFSSLLQLPAWIKAIFVRKPSNSEIAGLKQATDLLFAISKFIATIGVATGLVRSMRKKMKMMLPMLAFLACNLVVHMMRVDTRPRYCFLLVPIIMILFCYGWQAILGFINKKAPMVISMTFCAIAIIISLVWTFRFVPSLKAAGMISPICGSLLIASMLAIILYAATGLFLNKAKAPIRIISMTAIITLMIFSNHFNLVRTIRDGKRDAEFRMLAKWFVKNTQPGEKLVTSLPEVVKLFVPDRKQDIVHVSNIGGATPQEFVASCYKKNITHVAWDSRVGMRPKYSYYNKWRIKRIDALRKPESIGPYEFIDQVGQNNRMFINIFRLKKP